MAIGVANNRLHFHVDEGMQMVGLRHLAVLNTGPQLQSIKRFRSSTNSTQAAREAMSNRQRTNAGDVCD
jgi:hypothetical protein